MSTPDDAPDAPEPVTVGTGPAPDGDVPAPARSGTDEPVLPDRSADDTDAGWGEAPTDDDERLRRDVPPHWG